MLQKISHFVQYNNAVPIFLGVIFLGSGMAFAASEEVRDTVLSSQQELRSIDNGRIVNVDLTTYETAIEITAVTEDELFYFVAYNLHTIDLVDGVWQDVAKEQVLKVAKEAIEGEDLGTYATKELAQVREFELTRLRETQEIEREHGLSSKTVATVYSGLVGKFLDEKSETIPGYVPVVVEQPAAPYPGTEADAATNASTQSDSSQGGAQDGATNGSTIVGDPTDSVPPVISILGNNPAYIPLRSQYSDLGAYVYDNKQGTLGYEVFLDGTKVQSVQIDTATTTSYTVTYKAKDQVGNTSTATRTINVYDPAVTTPPKATPSEPTATQPTPTGGSGTTTTTTTTPTTTTSGGTGTTTATTTTSQATTTPTTSPTQATTTASTTPAVVEEEPEPQEAPAEEAPAPQETSTTTPQATQSTAEVTQTPTTTATTTDSE